LRQLTPDLVGELTPVSDAVNTGTDENRGIADTPPYSIAKPLIRQWLSRGEFKLLHLYLHPE
jgi:hypothetical protein